MKWQIWKCELRKLVFTRTDTFLTSLIYYTADPGRDNVQTNCSIISTSLPTVTAAGGVIANGTNNVTLYCICYRSNIAVGPTWWYFNGIQVTLTEDNGSGDPYYRDNVPSALIIPSFVTGHDGNYSCGNLNININDISLHGDTIILTLPGMYCLLLARYVRM